MPKHLAALIKNYYFETGLSLNENQSFVLLSIKAEETHIFIEQNIAQPQSSFVLNLGYEKTAHDFFKHCPPTPLEIETAINTVEDEIIPLHTKINSSSLLVTTDTMIAQIALLAVIPKATVILLSLEAMERVFNRFADIVSGRPATLDMLPDSSAFAATLLILREWMHHLRFETMHIISEQ